jgi:hypothetical protein
LQNPNVHLTTDLWTTIYKDNPNVKVLKKKPASGGTLTGKKAELTLSCFVLRYSRTLNYLEHRLITLTQNPYKSNEI